METENAKRGEWADMIALNLTASVLGIDIVVIPCFRESSIHQGLGLTVIRALEKPRYDPVFLFYFSETDFASAHYQSIRPREENNVVETFLMQNDTDRKTVLSSLQLGRFADLRQLNHQLHST